MPGKVEVINLLHQPTNDGLVAPEVLERETGEESFQDIVNLVQAVLEVEGVEGRLTVALVQEETISELNAHYRGIEGPTDVLSFCYAAAREEDLAPEEQFPADLYVDEDEQQLVDLGEIAVCPAVVERYASEEGEDPARRFAWTILHGVLHLLGYDHEIDDGEMLSREQALLRQLEPVVRAVSLPRTS